MFFTSLCVKSVTVTFDLEKKNIATLASSINWIWLHTNVLIILKLQHQPPGNP